MISTRVNEIRPSSTMNLIARASMLRSEGVDLADLGAGQPDFKVPPSVIEATSKSMKDGNTGYGPAGGRQSLREAVAERYNRRHGSRYKWQNTLISAGAKGALYHVLGAHVNPGDEVVVPLPYFVSYPEQVRLWDGVPRFLECREENGYLHTLDDLKAAIGPKTKGIVLNSPHNPTGAVMTRNLLRDTLEIAGEAGLFVVLDDVYNRFVYDGRVHTCISDLHPQPSKERPFYVVGSFGKTFSMTGFRLGFILGPVEGIASALRIQAHSITSVVTFIQDGAVEALAREDAIFETHLTRFALRRDLMHGLLSELPGVEVKKAPGAFFAFPDVSAWMEKLKVDSVDDVARILLEEARVVAVPGTAFGVENHLRFSYAASEETIKEAFRRIREFLAH